MDSYIAIDISRMPDLHTVDVEGRSSCLPACSDAMFSDIRRNEENTDVIKVVEGVGLFYADDPVIAERLSDSSILACGGQASARGMADNVFKMLESALPDSLSVFTEGLHNNGHVHGECLTDTGRTLEENLENVIFSTDQDVIYPVSNSITSKGMTFGVKRSFALFGDYCFSDETEVAFGGPHTLIQDEDVISVNACNEVAAEISIGKPAIYSDETAFIHRALSGILQEYSKQVGSAQAGAVTHPGGRKEVVCYADI